MFIRLDPEHNRNREKHLPIPSSPKDVSSRVWAALRRTRSALPGLSVGRDGLVVGTGVFVLGFAVTYVLEGLRVRSPTRPLVEMYFSSIDAGGELNVGPMGPLPDAYQFAAWQYLSLHGVSFGRPAERWWTLAPPETHLLVFVPALLLLAAGGVVVGRHGTDDPWTAAKRGGTVALGYLPLVVLTVLATQWVAPESVAFESWGLTTTDDRLVWTIGLSPVYVAPIAGGFYPVTFGAVGGYLAFLWSRGTWPSREVARGVVAGALAFLVGWGLTVRRAFYRASSGENWETTLVRGGWDNDGVVLEPGAFRVGTWQFHRLHGGNVKLRYLDYVADGFDAVRLPALTAGTSRFDPVFVLAPALLAIAGAALAHRAEKSTTRGAAARGSAVVLGYLPLSLATALLTTSESPGSTRAVVGVEFVDAFLSTGLAFPVAFGAVGGIVAHSIMTGTALVIDAVERPR